MATTCCVNQPMSLYQFVQYHVPNDEVEKQILPYVPSCTKIEQKLRIGLEWSEAAVLSYLSKFTGRLLFMRLDAALRAIRTVGMASLHVAAWKIGRHRKTMLLKPLAWMFTSITFWHWLLMWSYRHHAIVIMEMNYPCKKEECTTCKKTNEIVARFYIPFVSKLLIKIQEGSLVTS